VGVEVRLGILPAAGCAQRFGGIIKEMLPNKNGFTLINNAVNNFSFLDMVVVVTNKEKISIHAQTVKALFMIQEGSGLIGAIRTALKIEADRYYFAMPDTLFSPSPKELFNTNADFVMGVFETNMPERFGVISDGMILDKYFDLPKPSIAWGAVCWSKAVRDLWLDNEYADFTEMMNHAIEVFGYETARIEKYYDIAAIKDYKEMLCG